MNARFRLIFRQYNSPYDLDLLNGELKTRMQARKVNQSGWTTQSSGRWTMYIHSFYSTGGCYAELPSKSKLRVTWKNNDEECLLCCLIAYQHPAKHTAERMSNSNKPEYFIEI